MEDATVGKVNHPAYVAARRVAGARTRGCRTVGSDGTAANDRPSRLSHRYLRERATVASRPSLRDAPLVEIGVVAWDDIRSPAISPSPRIRRACSRAANIENREEKKNLWKAYAALTSFRRDRLASPRPHARFSRSE